MLFADYQSYVDCRIESASLRTRTLDPDVDSQRGALGKFRRIVPSGLLRQDLKAKPVRVEV